MAAPFSESDIRAEYDRIRGLGPALRRLARDYVVSLDYASDPAAASSSSSALCGLPPKALNVATNVHAALDKNTPVTRASFVARVRAALKKQGVQADASALVQRLFRSRTVFPARADHERVLLAHFFGMTPSKYESESQLVTLLKQKDEKASDADARRALLNLVAIQDLEVSIGARPRVREDDVEGGVEPLYRRTLFGYLATMTRGSGRVSFEQLVSALQKHASMVMVDAPADRDAIAAFARDHLRMLADKARGRGRMPFVVEMRGDEPVGVRSRALLQGGTAIPDYEAERCEAVGAAARWRDRVRVTSNDVHAFFLAFGARTDKQLDMLLRHYERSQVESRPAWTVVLMRALLAMRAVGLSVRSVRLRDFHALVKLAARAGVGGGGLRTGALPASQLPGLLRHADDRFPEELFAARKRNSADVNARLRDARKRLQTRDPLADPEDEEKQENKDEEKQDGKDDGRAIETLARQLANRIRLAVQLGRVTRPPPGAAEAVRELAAQLLERKDPGAGAMAVSDRARAYARATLLAQKAVKEEAGKLVLYAPARARPPRERNPEQKQARKPALIRERRAPLASQMLNKLADMQRQRKKPVLVSDFYRSSEEWLKKQEFAGQTSESVFKKLVAHLVKEKRVVARGRGAERTLEVAGRYMDAHPIRDDDEAFGRHYLRRVRRRQHFPPTPDVDAVLADEDGGAGNSASDREADIEEAAELEGDAFKRRDAARRADEADEAEATLFAKEEQAEVDSAAARARLREQFSRALVNSRREKLAVERRVLAPQKNANKEAPKPAVVPTPLRWDAANDQKTTPLRERLPPNANVRYLWKSGRGLTVELIGLAKEAVRRYPLESLDFTRNVDLKPHMSKYYDLVQSDSIESDLACLVRHGSMPVVIAFLTPGERTRYQDMDQVASTLAAKSDAETKTQARAKAKDVLELVYVTRLKTADAYRGNNISVLSAILEWMRGRRTHSFAFAVLEEKAPIPGLLSQHASIRDLLYLSEDEVAPAHKSTLVRTGDQSDILVSGPLSSQYAQSGWKLAILAYDASRAYSNPRVYLPGEREAFAADSAFTGEETVTGRGRGRTRILRTYALIAFQSLTGKAAPDDVLGPIARQRLISIATAIQIPNVSQAARVVHESVLATLRDTAASYDAVTGALRNLLALLERAQAPESVRVRVQRLLDELA